MGTVQDAVRSGVSFVCATCQHWPLHENPRTAQCRMAVLGRMCGGPLSWQAFPLYEGPLRGKMAMVCFVCGARSDAAAVAGPSRSLVGVCKSHLPMLETFSEPGSRPAFVSHKRVPVVE